jgi:uncharacterized membrane protein
MPRLLSRNSPQRHWWTRFCGLALAAVLSAGSTWAHGPARKTAVRTVSAEERAAFAAAKPALDKHCARCHIAGGRKAKPKTLKHFNLTRYPPTGHHAHETGAVVRRVLLGDKAKGKEPTMPADDIGAVTGDELKKVVAWTEAVDRAPRPAREPPPGKSGEKARPPASSSHHH